MRWSVIKRRVLRERSALATALHGALASLGALAVAELLHLECPYWAAMTALIVIQPSRGLLLEKSFYRLVGTALGSFGGMLIVQQAHSPLGLAALLALWLAACVGTGNLLYGLRSYGALVAGCTGAVIALAGYSMPPHLHDLVFGRIAGIVVGIVVSTTLTLFYTRHRSHRELLDRLAAAVAGNLGWVAGTLRHAPVAEREDRRQELLVELARIEETLDGFWAGSLALKRRKREINALLVALLAVLESGKTLAGRHRPDTQRWSEALADELDGVVRQLETPGVTRIEVTQVMRRLAEAPATAGTLVAALEEVLGSWCRGIENWQERAATREVPSLKLVRHRDWHQGARAALRAASSMLAVGLVWQLTGWGQGPVMMMAASIMVSIFSTQERPAWLLKHIFCGASVGVACGLFCRLVLLPGESGTLAQGLWAAPFLVLGLWAKTKPRFSLGGMDAVLFFLFVMQPGVSRMPPAPEYLAGGAASLGGIGVAILAFRYLLPVDPGHRLRSVLAAIGRDLAGLAAARELSRLEHCGARVQHRVLRMLVLAQAAGEDLRPVVEAALGALSLCRELRQLREAELSAGLPPEPSAALRVAARTLSLAARNPETLRQALQPSAPTAG